MSNYIKVNNQYREIQSIYKKISEIWTIINNIQNAFDDTLYFYDPTSIDISATLQIIGESQYIGKSFILSAKYGDRYDITIHDRKILTKTVINEE